VDERAKAAYVAEQAEQSRRAAKAIECPRCGAPCLRGDDDDQCAATVTVDTQPIDPVMEMLTILNGQLTYDLIAARGKGRGTQHLHLRYPHNYLSTKTSNTVHAKHRCDPNRKATPRDAEMPSLW
jgi:hypothetical protein